MNHAFWSLPPEHSMSYILDALQRADAERSGGGNRLAQAPLSGSGHSVKRPESKRRAFVLLGLLGTGIVAAASLAWYFFSDAENTSESPPPEEPPTVMAPAPSTQAAAPPPALEVPPLGSAGLGPRPMTPPDTPVPILQAEQPRLSPAGPAPTPSPRKAPEPQAETEAESVEANASPPTFPTPAPPAVASLPTGGDAGIRITGSSYSANRSMRMLIVNGKVVKEGQEVEPGLTLEVISPRSAVFNRQGSRFNVNF